MLCGCQQQPKAVAPTEPPPRQTAKADSDTDQSCSYFYFLWGRHAELLLQFEEALEAYQKALICDPQAEFISEKVPLLLLRLERTDEAARWLQTYLAVHPEKTGMRMLYAKVLLRQKKNTLAMEQYQLINDLHPDDPAILLLLAEMYLPSNQPEKARPLLERVLSLDQNSYPGHVLLARLFQLQGKTDEAVEQYQKALERNWSSELQMELGELYIKSARYEEAAALYKDLIAREEQNESARIALVHVYLLQKNDEQALAELNQLRAFADQPRRVDLTIARIYAKQQHYDKAIAITEKILEKENLPEARYFLAVLLVQAKKYERALKQVRQINRKAAEYSEALFLQVRILRELNRLDEARRVLEKNITAVDTRNAEMYLMLAALHQLQGRDDLSKKALLQGIEVYPEDENLLYEYGLLLENSGDHNAALLIMQKIIELKPDNAAALNFVGYSWADKKVNLDKALDYIQRAIELKPENGFIYDSLGWVYYRLGKIEQAVKALEKAAKLSPDDPAILDHLGDVYLESGRVQQALEAYRKAVKFSSDNEKEKNRIVEKIRIIEKQGKP
jgi:tetratricopeptide (TPR) repeat protein